jgi:hypothetical protein
MWDLSIVLKLLYELIVAETLNLIGKLELFQNFSTKREWSEPNCLKFIPFCKYSIRPMVTILIHHIRMMANYSGGIIQHGH